VATMSSAEGSEKSKEMRWNIRPICDTDTCNCTVELGSTSTLSVL